MFAQLYLAFRYIVDVLGLRSILSPRISYPHSPMGGTPYASQTLSQEASKAGLLLVADVLFSRQGTVSRGSQIVSNGLEGSPGRGGRVRVVDGSQGFSEGFRSYSKSSRGCQEKKMDEIDFTNLLTGNKVKCYNARFSRIGQNGYKAYVRNTMIKYDLWSYVIL